MADAQRPEPEDDELLLRARRGDGDAFERLVTRHAARLGRLVSALVDDQDTVADLVQEAFVRAWQAKDLHRGGNVAGWLGRIAVNVARDHRRSGWIRRVMLRAEPIGEHRRGRGGVDAADLRDDQRRRIRAAVAGLPPNQAEAVRLRFLLGESYVAMEQLLGVPESTLRSRVEAGLRRLKTVLGESLDG